RIEFPVNRTIPPHEGEPIQATVAHEIIHVYFPNANRMLAEGIAINVQDETMRNRAYPKFGIPVHESLFCYPKKDNSFPSIQSLLPTIHLPDLDSIGTPKALTVDLTDEFFDEDRMNLAYLVSGSFVRYLIETYTMDQFQRLYRTTPFKARYVRRPPMRDKDDWT